MERSEWLEVYDIFWETICRPVYMARAFLDSDVEFA